MELAVLAAALLLCIFPSEIGLLVAGAFRITQGDGPESGVKILPQLNHDVIRISRHTLSGQSRSPLPIYGKCQVYSIYEPIL